MVKAASSKGLSKKLCGINTKQISLFYLVDSSSCIQLRYEMNQIQSVCYLKKITKDKLGFRKRLLPDMGCRVFVAGASQRHDRPVSIFAANCWNIWMNLCWNVRRYLSRR